MKFNQIPDEIKTLRQFIIFIVEGGNKVPYSPETGYKTSPKNVDAFCSFETSVETIKNLRSRNIDCGLNFCLTNEDPYAIIDLDYTEDEEKKKLQKEIYESCTTYSEVSPSGRGMHLVFKIPELVGSKLKGVNAKGIEFYFAEKSISFTGDIVAGRSEIKSDEGPTFMHFYSELKGKNGAASNFSLQQKANEEVRQSDEEIINVACGAKNGEKFKSLYFDDYEEGCDKSSADLALMSIITFYTDNHQQAIRIFRASPYKGARDKAQIDSYMELTCKRAYSDKKVFDAKDLDFSEAFEALSQQHDEAPLALEPTYSKNWPTPPQCSINQIRKVLQRASIDTSILSRPMPALEHANSNAPLWQQPPPGHFLELLNWMHASSAKKIPEVILGSALAFLAGFCGRAYTTRNGELGSNLYCLVTAPSGIGKSFGLRKVAELLTKVVELARSEGAGAVKQAEAIEGFIAKQKPVSARGLFNQLQDQPSLMIPIPEFGDTFSTATQSGRDGGLRGLLNDVYSQSGKFGSLSGGAYAQRENNTKQVKSPALSIFGESNRYSVIEIIDDTTISSGMIPRVLWLDYRGDYEMTPQDMKAVAPSDFVIGKFYSFAIACHERNVQIDTQPTAKRADLTADEIPDSRIDAQLCDETRALICRWDAECIAMANRSKEEARMKGEPDLKGAIYARLVENTLRIATIVAAYENPTYPQINPPLLLWAREVVIKSRDNIINAIDSNEINAGVAIDYSEHILLAYSKLIEHFRKPYDDTTRAVKRQGFEREREIFKHSKGLFTKKLISDLCQQKAFRDPKLNNNKSRSQVIDETIRQMIEHEKIELVDDYNLKIRFKMSTTVKLYAIKLES